MDNNEIDTSQLYHIFKNIPDGNRLICTDTFTCLCYLHSQGEKQAVAVQKLLPELFKLINPINDPEINDLLFKVRQELSGNEEKIGTSAATRNEFSALFRD